MRDPLAGLSNMIPPGVSYSVVAAASGDGLIHEVINGFAVHDDAKRALRIPIVQLPTGA